ncbi:MAG: xanthine dehydrogenase family protein molybdopterin-binding subunit [Acidobacteria bacterium]|nr:xanthine dehydrogenase family protein molybdopterin-binding subunit [Acidobacteriota bacterium]
MSRHVGRNVARKDGAAKTGGTARYVDDLTWPGLLHGRTIRSSIPCGEITGIRFDFDRSGFTVVDAGDIPGRNVVSLITDDQPCLANRVIHHAAEPILLVAHEDPERLLGARVEINYRAATPVFDADRSQRVFKHVRIEKGSLDEGFARADVVVEGEYRTGHQEHLYLEPNGMIAVPGDGGVTLYGSLQCPYYVHKALCTLLALPADKVRVVQAETGGGFGGKEDYPSIIAGHAALLALASGRPVKMVYDRVEDMMATTKRHPSIVRHRTGVMRDGRLVAMDISVVMDGGAYCTLSPVVLSRGCIHATGPYRCEHVRVDGRVVMTNTPPNGAFRGFGAPQTLFAAEVHMERIAEALGMDPVRLREKNAFIPGDVTATGQTLGPDTAALDVLRATVARADFHKKRRAFRGTNRGIGLSLFFHGAGFTGSGEVYLASKASLELTTSGVRVLVASTEIGQGQRTVHAQIVADALGIPIDHVEVEAADTLFVPNSGPTVASRTTMVVGGLLQRCAGEMRERLGSLSPAEYRRKHGPLVITRQYEPPPGLVWDDETYRGSAYGTFGWGCDIVEVELDPVTFEVRPTRVATAQEVGKAIYPLGVRGQIEGGTVQGLGYALLEDVVMRDGAMANAQLTNYIIPTTLDTPPMDVLVLERGYAHGPYGAKGIGEMPFDGVAPAVVNAIRSLGIDIRAVPATPERISEAVTERRRTRPDGGRRGAIHRARKRDGASR